MRRVLSHDRAQFWRMVVRVERGRWLKPVKLRVRRKVNIPPLGERR